jgi:hypothetical protein
VIDRVAKACVIESSADMNLGWVENGWYCRKEGENK